MSRYKEFGRLLRSQIVDGVSYLHAEMELGKKVLIEGANAALLDIDFGTYPYVSSLLPAISQYKYARQKKVEIHNYRSLD